MGSRSIVFDVFSIDVGKRVIKRNGEDVHLAKKPFDVLLYLIDRRGELVTRDELLAKFWSGADAYDEAVYSCISAIRKALGDLGDEPRYLETRWREGYRFIGNVDRTSRRARARTVAIGTAAAAAALWLAVAGVNSARSPEADASAPIASLAVLPLQAPDVDLWLRRGLTEELLHTISSIEGFRVVTVSETSNLDDEAISRLDVDALLESTLLVAGDEQDLHLRLLRRSDRSVVWSFRGRYRPDQLAGSRADIVASLVNRLSATLRGAPVRAPANAAAWRLYLSARHQWSLRTPQSILAAMDLYKQAIEADENYADAHAGLAESYAVAPLWAGADATEAYAAVLDSANRALELDPDHARAHTALAVYYAHHRFDWEKSEYYFARALDLDPNDVTAHQWKADAYCYRLLFEACTRHMAIARSLDPLSPFVEMLQGIPLRFTKQYVAAEEHFRGILARYPNLAPARFQLGIVLDAQGRYEEALEHFERIYPVYGPALLGSSIAWANAQLGNHQAARDMVAVLRRLNDESSLPPVMMAGAASVYGSDREILHWLTRARDEHDDFFSSVAVVHHFFHLHVHPEFQALTGELGIPRERLLAYHGSPSTPPGLPPTGERQIK
ncbi:MAG: winged helix-turn-helix domain-containing protein [Proteobacteria bacterium]|nr:winged helix-turn-helix domain-containing protein [Pseudomonadota bacterium]